MLLAKNTLRQFKQTLLFFKNTLLDHLETVIHAVGFKNFSFFNVSQATQSEWDPETIQWVRQENWVQATWKSGPALVHKSGSRTSFYWGQKFDAQYIDLVENGWTHDHCAVCYETLFETDDPKHGIGYTNESDWICSACYNNYIGTDAADPSTEEPPPTTPIPE